MTRQVFDVTLAIESPFLFAGLESARFGADVCTLRDAASRPIIPSAHVKGHFREALEALLFAADSQSIMRALFGGESTSNIDEADSDIVDQTATAGEQNMPNPGVISFTDFVAEELEKPNQGTFNRVHIDDTTGAAKTGMLVMVELAAPLGMVVNFKGQIHISTVPEGLQDARALLEECFNMIGSMGAMRSSGFGLLDAKASRVAVASADARAKSQTVSDLTKSGGVKRFAVDVSFDRPLMVDATRDVENMFVSSTIVPGAALKGAIASTLGLEEEEQEAFSSLLVSHAWPLVSEGEKGALLGDRTLPLALMADQAKTPVEFHDLSRGMGADASFYLKDLIVQGASLSTLPDWKNASFKDARDLLGRPESKLTKLPRGRVKIDSDKGVAEKSKLFFSTVVSNIDNSAGLVKWRFILDFGQIKNDASCQKLKEKLEAALRSGLHSVGKTKACSAQLKLSPTAIPDFKGGTGERVCLLLETPTVMTDPRSADHPEIQYERYFKSLLGKGAVLATHFAQRQLAGGYIAFRRKGYGKDKYLPFELTNAGAVFVLNLDHEAREALEDYLRFGLPAVRQSMDDGREEALHRFSWKECPFVSENGYGEITFAGGFLAPLEDRRYSND